MNLHSNMRIKGENSRRGFFDLSTTDILGWITAVGGNPVLAGC